MKNKCFANQFMTGVLLLVSLSAASPSQATTYSVAIPSMVKIYPLDLAHPDSNEVMTWSNINFGQSFNDPLASIRFEISGHIVFPENIDNATGMTVQAPPGTTFEIGPEVESDWLGTGMRIQMQSDTNVLDPFNDNSHLELFTLDNFGNFTSSFVLNNTGGSAGASVFNAFQNGGAIGLGLAYDGFGAYLSGQTYSKAGSIALTSAVLSVSTDQYLQPSPVPEPTQSVLFMVGLSLLLPALVRRRKA